MTTYTRESLRFGGLTIEYDDRVLRPRPWTELQSRWGAELLQDAAPGPVLELCSGAGHIGLLLAALADRPLVAVDLNPAACYFTAHNAEGAGLSGRVEVREGRLEEALREQEQFALVSADPPWVTTEGVAEFPEDPLLAIDGGADGLAVARACLLACSGHVMTGGSVLVQLGSDAQADALSSWAQERGWEAGARRTGERGVVQQYLVADGDS